MVISISLPQVPYAAWPCLVLVTHAGRVLRPLEARSYSLPRGGCFARLLNHRHTSSTFGRQHPKRRISHDTMHNRFVSCTRDAVDVKSKFTSCRKTTSSTPAWDHLHLPRSASCQLRAWIHVAKQSIPKGGAGNINAGKSVLVQGTKWPANQASRRPIPFHATSGLLGLLHRCGCGCLGRLRRWRCTSVDV